MCSASGHIDRLRHENYAAFACRAWRVSLNAELTAAINILHRGNTAVLDVEARRRAGRFQSVNLQDGSLAAPLRILAFQDKEDVKGSFATGAFILFSPRKPGPSGPGGIGGLSVLALACVLGPF